MEEKILSFIKKFRDKKGYAPNQSEIARGLNTSRQHIGYYFSKLRDKLKKYPEYARFF